MSPDCVEYPELGLTAILYDDGTVDWVAWEPDDDDIRADESESLSDETA